MNNCWHLSDLATLEKQLNTDLSDGLTAREARLRLEHRRKKDGKGAGSLFVAPKTPMLKGAFAFASSPFLILLAVLSLITAVIAAISSDERGFLIGGSVLAVCVAATLVGGVFTFRARKRLDAMREYASPMVKVRRCGNIMYTDGRNLVEGDLILLRTGDLLPCDARILKGNLQVEELFANGNGIGKRSVQKSADAVYDENASLKATEAGNMLFAGTAVVSGDALALVCAVGSDVVLAEHVPEGALGGRETEAEGVRMLRPVCYKISFISAAAFLILSLLSLLTLRGKESFICEFCALAAAISFITAEMLSNGANGIISHHMKRLALSKDHKNKKKNTSAAVRNVKAMDTLSGVDELVLVGRAGLGEGSFRVTSAYTPRGVLQALTPETAEGRRLLTLLHTYSKALRESGVTNSFVEEGFLDAFFGHLRLCGFDVNGANLAIRSLYFAGDANRGSGYACAETDSEFYRTSLFVSPELFEGCKLIRDGASTREMYEDDRQNISVYRNNAMARGYKCVYMVSESDGKMVFEGVISFEQLCDTELTRVVKELRELNVRTTVLLGKEGEQTAKLIAEPALASLFSGQIAYGSAFAKQKQSILDGFGSYCAYVGFSDAEYGELIAHMRSRGSKVAAFGINTDQNPILARADVAISCDVLKYSSDKYRESVYEKMPPEGRENNVRCSQQTRLLSKVIVNRFSEKGGGMLSVLHTLRTAKSAYVVFGLSLLLFVFLMLPILVFTAMSVLTGTVLLDPLQTAALAAVTAIFAMTVFNDAEIKNEVLSKKRNFIAYPSELVRENLIPICAKACVPFLSAIVIRILEAVGVFGEDPAFTLPVYICVMFTGFAEVFLLNRAYTKKGEGRGLCWMKVMIAYCVLLAVCAVETQGAFMNAFFANGIGDREFFLVPAYVALYMISLGVIRILRKKSK